MTELLDWSMSARSGHARTGSLLTPRGGMKTPAFMPVGTQASVKGVSSAELREAGVEILICNTYHLWLRPGADAVAALGGLHEFMRWPGLIATDSGGYQAFSLAERVKLTPDGFTFASHLDGSTHELSAEKAILLQAELGSDLSMQLDICPSAGADEAALEQAVRITTEWARRGLSVRAPHQAMFGIVQGGSDVLLRRRHLDALEQLPLQGLALGGFSVGEPPETMHRVLRAVAPYMDPARPHYLMGVGTPRDLIVAIGLGIDLFDCVLPTRNARNGQVFVDPARAELSSLAAGPRLVIKNRIFRDDARPLEPGCGCPACSAGYSRAYLRHLFLARELLAYRLLSLHNLHFYLRLIADARQAIVEQRYELWACRRLGQLGYAADVAMFP